MTEKLPQRFRYKPDSDSVWQYGVVIPRDNIWLIRVARGHGSFSDDPWESLGAIIGDVAAFEWIDNQFGWTGDNMPLPAGADIRRVAECRKRIFDPYVCWTEGAHEIAKDLLAEVERLDISNNMLQSIASNGWIEAWHCGNDFMALPPDDDQATVLRCWQESQTLRALQKLNSR